MAKYLLKRADSHQRGDVAAVIVDAPSREAALAKVTLPGAWKIHREISDREMRDARAAVTTAPFRA